MHLKYLAMTQKLSDVHKIRIQYTYIQVFVPSYQKTRLGYKLYGIFYYVIILKNFSFLKGPRNIPWSKTLYDSTRHAPFFVVTLYLSTESVRKLF